MHTTTLINGIVLVCAIASTWFFIRVAVQYLLDAYSSYKTKHHDTVKDI